MPSVQDNWSADFIAQKNSRTSKPIILIDLYLGSQDAVDSSTYFFNDSNYSLFFWPYRNLQTQQAYAALGLSRGAINKSAAASDTASIVLDNVSRSFSTLFASVDFRGKRVVIREVYADILTASGDFDLLFDGIIDRPQLSLEDGLKLEVRPSLVDSLDFTIPQEEFMPQCNNRFLGTECANGISAATLRAKVTGQTIDSAVSQIELVDAARVEADTHFTPGIMEMTAGTAGNIGRKRRVVQMSGDHIFLDMQFPNAVVAGDVYSLERDCDKSYEECKDKFSNDVNYRGFRYVPHELTD